MAKNYKLITNNHCDHIVVSVKCMLELASVLATACREHVTAKTLILNSLQFYKIQRDRERK